jgi:hypothetical protein
MPTNYQLQQEHLWEIQKGGTQFYKDRAGTRRDIDNAGEYNGGHGPPYFLSGLRLLFSFIRPAS